jgi:hypothetical protein
MAFVSPALVSRIFQALGQNRGGYAVRLLRQHQFENGDNPAGDAELLGSLLCTAYQCAAQGDEARAEDHFRLVLALYENCFGDRHIDALQCCTGLLSLLENSGKDKEALEIMRRIEDIVGLARESVTAKQVIAIG